MKLDDLIFLSALLVLWMPFPSLTERFRHRSLLGHYSPPEFEQISRRWQNYVDLLRGALGAYVISKMTLNVQFEAAGLGGYAGWMPHIVLGLGVLLQTVRLPIPAVIVAPVFYLSGLTLILPGLLEGAFALLFGWSFALATKDIRHQLPAMGLALLLAGVFNNGLNDQLLLNASFVLAPPTLAILLNRRLVMANGDSRYARCRAKSQQISAAEPASSHKLTEAQASSNS